MKIRLVAYCPRCGSHSFRPSALRIARDAVFRSFGLKPLRCRMCRFRFYSFDLHHLRNCLTLLEGRRPAGQELNAIAPGVETGPRRTGSQRRLY